MLWLTILQSVPLRRGLSYSGFDGFDWSFELDTGLLRADDVPDHANYHSALSYEALSLAQIRKSDIELVTTSTIAANPGKFFKDERKWPEWEKDFVN